MPEQPDHTGCGEDQNRQKRAIFVRACDASSHASIPLRLKDCELRHTLYNVRC